MKKKIEKEEFNELANKIVKDIKNRLIMKSTIIGILNREKYLADYISEQLKFNIKYINIHTRNEESENLGVMTINDIIDITIYRFL